MIDLRLGDWRTALADVEPDVVITDPPYGAATHAGHNKGRPQIMSATGQATGRELNYAAWAADDVHEFVRFWGPRTRSWMVCFTSDDLIDDYRDAFRAAGRYSFAPVIVIQKVPRLLGDGPASWARYLMVARPRTRDAQRWRCTPGEYTAKLERGAPIVGAKPVALMQQIVRDYSNPGDLVCDPCAGWGSTLIAAALEGRRAVGADVSETTHTAAQLRLAAG
jgi:site-specific DNA-methyltransferase (adenine-specific)